MEEKQGQDTAVHVHDPISQEVSTASLWVQGQTDLPQRQEHFTKKKNERKLYSQNILNYKEDKQRVFIYVISFLWLWNMSIRALIETQVRIYFSQSTCIGRACLFISGHSDMNNKAKQY